MGAFLDKPKTEKVNVSRSGNGIRFGLSSMQGWRVEMEDAHSAVLDIQGLKDWSFFAVFDGHAGAKVSAYCSDNLLKSIINNDDFRGTNKASSTPEDNMKEGIRQGFLNLDETMRKDHEKEGGEDKSGSTAVCCMITPTSIVFGNCGDSRGILVRDKKVCFSTQDHKPINPIEKERIQNAGGSVMIQRVNGSLAVSRALGDYEYKNVEGKSPIEQLVSPEPEVDLFKRNHERDEFVVLACDGIWDVMSNEELANFIRSRMLLTDNLALICNEVVDTCLYKGSRDNMSIIIISLEDAPKVSPEEIRKEEELNKYLEERVRAIDSEEADLPYVMHILSSEQIDGLPPGGGLPAKRSVVEAFFHKLHPESAEQRSDED